MIIRSNSNTNNSKCFQILENIKCGPFFKFMKFYDHPINLRHPKFEKRSLKHMCDSFWSADWNHIQSKLKLHALIINTIKKRKKMLLLEFNQNVFKNPSAIFINSSVKNSCKKNSLFIETHCLRLWSNSNAYSPFYGESTSIIWCLASS